MADRMIIMPPKITARQKTTVPRLDYLFVYPDIFIGAPVRLIVYEIDTYFRRGVGNVSEGDEAKDWGKFKAGTQNPAKLRSQPVGDSQQDPALRDGAGICLKVDGTLFRSSKLAAPRGWWFEPLAGVTENPNPFSLINLHMPMTEQDAIAGRVNSKPIGRITIRDDSWRTQNNNQRIVFRVALTGFYAGLAQGTVIASSLCPEHNPACPPLPPNNPKNLGAIIFEEAAVKKGAPPKIGGNEDVSEPNAPVEQQDRFMPFDLTGSYEHVNRPSEPELIFQINQAGRCLVGWFSPAPRVGGTHSSVPNLPRLPGCFWVASMSEEDPSSRGFQLVWGIEDHEGPSRTDADIMDLQGKLQRTGWLKRLPQEGTTGTIVDDRLELTFEYDDGATVTFKLQKVRNGARWPWAIISNPRFFSPAQRDALIALQVCPTPTSGWDRMRRSLDSEQIVATVPKTRTITETIDFWARAGARASRDSACEAMGAYLERILLPWSMLGFEYQRSAAERLHSFASQSQVRAAETTDTLYKWLLKMATQKLDDLAISLPGTPKDQLVSQINRGFLVAGIIPRGNFIYTMNFNKFGIPKIPVVKIYAFQLTIKKSVWRPEQATFDLGPFPNWTDSEIFDGFFIGGGAGLGFGFGPESMQKLKPKFSSKEVRSGGLPSTAKFESFSDLETADFNGASFSIGAFAAGVGAGGGASGAATAGSMMEFHLKNGIDLTAIVSESFNKPVFDAKGIGPSAEVTLVDVSMGHGEITTDGVAKGTETPEDSSESIVKPTAADTMAWAPVLFDKDSSALLDRTYFERRLALNRAGFEVEQPKLACHGYTSPEGNADYNFALSSRRALAVKQALLESFPPEMAPGSVSIVPHGELSSLEKGGLHDPPGKTDEEKALIHDEERQYPMWRAVDLFLGALLVVRVGGKDEKKGK
jgi:hypothetical protein